MTTTKSIQKIISTMLKGLCHHPENLKIVTGETSRIVSMEIMPAPGDSSKIIGKKGTNIKALQRIAEKMGESLQKRIFITVTPPKVEDLSKKPYVYNPEYEADDEAKLLSELLNTIYHDSIIVKPYQLGERSLALIVKGIDIMDSELESDLTTIFNGIAKNKGGQEIVVEFDC